MKKKTRSRHSSPGAKLGVKFQKAKCKDCGHVGKSQQPEYYQCGHCYYSHLAESSRATAEKLFSRANGLLREADRFKAKALAFRQRHPV